MGEAHQHPRGLFVCRTQLFSRAGLINSNKTRKRLSGEELEKNLLLSCYHQKSSRELNTDEGVVPAKKRRRVNEETGEVENVEESDQDSEEEELQINCQ